MARHVKRLRCRVATRLDAAAAMYHRRRLSPFEGRAAHGDLRVTVVEPRLPIARA
jgi:hypothetical protein